MKENYFEEWLNEYEEITSFSYMIFGHFGVRDNATINIGLTITIMEADESIRFGQSVEDIDEDMAEMFGVTRGTNIQWVFPGSLSEKMKQMIVEIINDGLEHLNIKYEFFGILGDLNAN
jgi:hypothetical protein